MGMSVVTCIIKRHTQRETNFKFKTTPKLSPPQYSTAIECIPCLIKERTHPILNISEQAEGRCSVCKEGEVYTELGGILPECVHVRFLGGLVVGVNQRGLDPELSHELGRQIG